MRRRRGDDAPVSFFSFQDVLLSLIGITVVITIILFLQISREALAAAESYRDERDSVATAAEVRNAELMQRIEVLEGAIREAQKRPDVDPLARRTSLRAELLATRERLESLERQSEELARQLREITMLNPGAIELQETAELMQRRDLLVAELGAIERRRRISFIQDTERTATPFLIEMSAARIVFCELQAEAAALRLAAGTPESRVRQAYDLFRLHSSGRDAYMLVILKPSGIRSFRKLLDLLETVPPDERPRIGLELIAEDSHISEAFPSAVGPQP